MALLQPAMTSSGALAGLSACECPVCFLTLSEGDHEPMSMPCGHTLCSACINHLVSMATSTSSQLGLPRVPTFQCPLCREWVSRDAVHLNVTLRDLLGQSSSHLTPPLNYLMMSFLQLSCLVSTRRAVVGSGCRLSMLTMRIYSLVTLLIVGRTVKCSEGCGRGTMLQ